ncbi:hypothetical protein [Azospirillum rugosum]|uniref:Uncharacterized protein n=1 Tax=Azospirillum rugosum TaxID=416170 RepID=A0ABS4SEX2_9PROT|nr:hypothetical protein [Azospirillum rugosum]MBP2291042.1 hypothetical protein [Azospirillum rugosum]MDQ0524894.1 hypothetical protein [Azospirillum rugosum]
MIDVPAVHAALLGPLEGGPIPPERIARKGKQFTPPDGDVPHARIAIAWEFNGKTGAALWEGVGMLQVLVCAPLGIDEDALHVEAAKVAALYRPHLDATPLAYGVRVVQLATDAATELDDRGATATGDPARWLAVPVHVDFRVERIDTAA